MPNTFDGGGSGRWPASVPKMSPFMWNIFSITDLAVGFLTRYTGFPCVTTAATYSRGCRWCRGFLT